MLPSRAFGNVLFPTYNNNSNQCMGMIRSHDGQRPMGEFGLDARGYTPTLFLSRPAGLTNTSSSST